MAPDVILILIKEAQTATAASTTSALGVEQDIVKQN